MVEKAKKIIKTAKWCKSHQKNILKKNPEKLEKERERETAREGNSKREGEGTHKKGFEVLNLSSNAISRVQQISILPYCGGSS